MTASMEEVLDFMEPWKNFKQRCGPFLHANQTTYPGRHRFSVASVDASLTDLGLQQRFAGDHSIPLGNARDSIYFCQWLWAHSEDKKRIRTTRAQRECSRRHS